MVWHVWALRVGVHRRAGEQVLLSSGRAAESSSEGTLEWGFPGRGGIQRNEGEGEF